MYLLIETHGKHTFHKAEIEQYDEADKSHGIVFTRSDSGHDFWLNMNTLKDMGSEASTETKVVGWIRKTFKKKHTPNWLKV